MARTRIVVLGGGYVGMYTAIGLERRLNPAEASITVIDPRSYMTYQPFLPEAASGSLSPRQVVVPLRRVLKRSLVLTAMVVSVDNSRKRVTVRPLEGEDYEVVRGQPEGYRFPVGIRRVHLHLADQPRSIRLLRPGRGG